MNKNTRIQLHDSGVDSVLKLSEGNPGAMEVLMTLMTESPLIDPDNMFGSLLSLDTLGIYGRRIWMLYKDVCGQDVVKMVAALRAVQMGLISEETLNHAIDHRGGGINLDVIMVDIKGQLPRFNDPTFMAEEKKRLRAEAEQLMKSGCGGNCGGGCHGTCGGGCHDINLTGIFSTEGGN
jgi:hypothetical protein